jgi:hypothetical protein
VQVARGVPSIDALVPPALVDRLCATNVATRSRRTNLHLSHVAAAVEDGTTVGFAAYRPSRGAVRVVHEFWIDGGARSRAPAVAGALLDALESLASDARVSRLLVVVRRATCLRRTFEAHGYVATLGRSELTRFEKTLGRNQEPLQCA